MELSPDIALAALCRELAPLEGKAPDWIEVLPAGPDIKGFDGRKWRLDDPQSVLNRFNQDGLKLVVDWEHGSEIRGPEGERVPAAGYVDALKLGDGGQVLAHVEWNREGADDIVCNRVKYISPAFRYTPQGQITRFTSFALTNQPNLKLAALNRQKQSQENDSMLAAVLKKLGLPETATEAEVTEALEKALNRAGQAPSLTEFVPRAEHELALNRAIKAEGELKAVREAELTKEIDVALDQAQQGGSITPASRDYFRAQCRREGGLKDFKELYLSKAPKVAEPSGLDGKKPPTDETELTDADRAYCRDNGIAQEKFIEWRKAEKSALNNGASK